jgi:transposase-like protein
MTNDFTFSQFTKFFPTNEACLEEIKRLRFRKGIYCTTCLKITKHYRLKQRNAYSCAFCRNQVYPLVGTIFEKTTTPLRLWFYALLLMTYTKAKISIRQLENELGVTYKTAWRMYHSIKTLMEKNNGDLLAEATEVYTWTFFNKIEISFVEKKKS